MQDTYNKIAFRYAKALFLFAGEQNKQKNVLDDLTGINNVLCSEKSLKDVIENTLISSEKKGAIIKTLFGSKIDVVTTQFVQFLSVKKRLDLIQDCFVCYRDLYYDANNMLQARITTAQSIEKDQQDALVEQLEQKFNKKIIAHFSKDAQQIAGFRVKISDHVFDLTAKAKLQQYKENILAA